MKKWLSLVEHSLAPGLAIDWLSHPPLLVIKMWEEKVQAFWELV